MRPRIDGTEFGSITIDGSDIEHDVLIRLSGEVKKRKKKLSKAVFGTSHTISLEEAEYIFEKGAERLIIGSGQNGMVTLSKEASEYFKKEGVRRSLTHPGSHSPVEQGERLNHRAFPCHLLIPGNRT